ncbi:hypothetical protein M5585_18780 [Serratia ureilytica]
MFRGLKAFLLLTLSLLFCQRAFADCATTNGTVTLPGSSSFVVYNGQINAQAPPASTAPASGYRCCRRTPSRSRLRRPPTAWRSPTPTVPAIKSPT